MKKLLSILASLAVAGSSASAVIACTVDVPTLGQPGDDTSSDGDGKIVNGGGDSGQGVTPDQGHSNSGSNSNNSHYYPNRHDGPNAKDLEAVKKDITDVAKSNILQDQFGINGKYLNHQLFNDRNLNAIGINHDGKNGQSSSIPLIDFLVSTGMIDKDKADKIEEYLPMLANVNAPTPTQLGGLASQLIMLAGPLKDTINGLISDPEGLKKSAESFLTPANKAIIDNLIASDNKLDSKYNNLTLGDSLKSILVGAARVLALGTNDVASSTGDFSHLERVTEGNDISDKAIDYIIKRAMEMFSTPKLDSAALLENDSDAENGLADVEIHGSKLPSDINDLSRWSLIDSKGNSLAIKNVVQKKDKDNKAVADTYVITFDGTQLTSTDKYTLVFTSAKTLGSNDDFKIALQPTSVDGIKNDMLNRWESAQSLINLEITKSSAIAFDINNLLGTDGIDTLTDILKMVGMYIEAFNKYEFTSTDKIDGNHVFKDENGRNNYQVITDVRNETIGSQEDGKGYKFDILKLISNISYYLGDIDKSEGEHKLQALLAIFFLDDDRSDQKTFVISDNASKSMKSKNMAPFAKLVSTLLTTVLPANKPDVFNNPLVDLLLTVMGLNWEQICKITDESVYSVMQSMIWDRGFSLDGNYLPLLEDGKHISKEVLKPLSGWKLTHGLDFPGLKALPQWSILKGQGVLSYLFNGNAYELLNSVKDEQNTYGFSKFYSQISDAKSDLKDTIQNAIQGVMEKVAPFSNDTPDRENIILKGKIGDYKKVIFENNGRQSILNTDLSKSKPSNTDWGKIYKKAYDAPKISKVVAGATTSQGTEIYVFAEGIYQGGWGQKYPNGIKDFGNSLTIDGKSISAFTLGDPIQMSGNGGYLHKVVYKGFIKGTVTESSKVSGNAVRYTGNDGSLFGGDQYPTREISNSAVNFLWNKDDLGFGSHFNFNLENDDWMNTASTILNKDEIASMPFLTITGFKNDSDKGIDIIDKKDMSKLINLKSVAAWKITDLLAVLGVKGFVKNETPFGPLPVADNFTLGGAILELGNIIKKPKYYAPLEEMLHDETFSYAKFKPLVDLIFGDKPENNFIDQLVDALTSNDLSSSLRNLFGIADTNVYDANKIIGALILTFTKGAHETSDGKVYGVLGDTTLWNYLIDTHNGILKQTWDVLNSDNRDVLLQRLSDDDNFTFENWTTDPKEKQDVTKVTVTVTYKYTWPKYTYDADGNIAVQANDAKGKYKITWEAGTASDKTGTYTVERII